MILTAAVVCLGAALRFGNLGNVGSRTPDESVYTHQARVWTDSASAGIRSLVEQYKSDPNIRLYPAPVRIGMIRIVAAAMHWTGRDDESAGALISCMASIGSLLVLALLAARLLPPGASLASLLLYAALPAELAIARRAWPDALLELAALLLVYFMCEIVRDSQRRIWYVLFALVGALGILVKESMPLPQFLCGSWIFWMLVKRREWPNALFLISTSVAATALSLWWLAHYVGSLSEYVEIVAWISRSNAVNPYALEYASGPGYLLLQAFWIVAPVTSLLSLAGLWSLFRKPKAAPARWEPLRGIAFFTVVHIAIGVVVPHWLNLRYVSATFGPFCLLAGLGLWYMVLEAPKWLELSDRRPIAGLAVALIVGSAIMDYRYFQRVFVRDGTADLSIKMLIDEHK
jgi:4-amino-4-deoxy-L-arabinose transferase-like glycosyltransferase